VSCARVDTLPSGGVSWWFRGGFVGASATRLSPPCRFDEHARPGAFRKLGKLLALALVLLAAALRALGLGVEHLRLLAWRQALEQVATGPCVVHERLERCPLPALRLRVGPVDHQREISSISSTSWKGGSEAPLYRVRSAAAAMR
jgi:hypothetical protein